MTTANVLMDIPVAHIIPNPEQPRKTFDADSIHGLGDSIREGRLIEPISVEDNGDGTYILVAGERRWRAFQYLERDTIPAVVCEKSNHGGRERLLEVLIENIQREDMNIIDVGEAYEALSTEHQMNNIEISLKVGKSTTLIGQARRAAKLPPEIKEMIRAGDMHYDAELISVLQSIPDVKLRIKLAKRISENKLNIKQSVIVARKAIGMVKAPKVELGTSESIAMRLVQRRSSRKFDENTAPKGWDALRQVKKVPQWSALTMSVTGACQACAIAMMANESTCRLCPLVDMLSRLLNEV